MLMGVRKDAEGSMFSYELSLASASSQGNNKDSGFSPNLAKARNYKQLSTS